MNIEHIDKYLQTSVDFLTQLISIPSLSGQESDAINFVYDVFSSVVDEIELIPLSDEVKNDPDYAKTIPDIKYDGRYNIRAVIKGSDAGRGLIFNTHADVVPPSASHIKPFDPFIKNKAVFGRGACDAKGQIATLYLLLQYLKSERIALKGDVIIHIVVEEENGGNGTLSAIRRGEKADAAIVLEPSNLHILPFVRGAVWFRVTCRGISGHSGSGGKRISAMDLAIGAKQILQQYHDQLLSKSKGIPLFDRYDDPMPITFGKLHAGDWPATVPNRAVLEGVLGFLNNKTKEEIMHDIETELRNSEKEDLEKHCGIEFTYRHDAQTLDVNHQLVKMLYESGKQMGLEPEISAMPASCDSWFYNNQLQIPTVVFGPGDLGVAHSDSEHIKISDIQKAGQMLATFLDNWSN